MDSRLHDLIADSCGNAFLAKEIGRLKTLFRAFRDVAWEHDEARNDFHRLAEEAHEHLAIVEALLAGDAEGGRPRHGAAHPLRRPLLEPGHAAAGRRIDTGTTRIRIKDKRSRP